MHPKDSLEDFKKFFTELAQIWNNGDVGEGLRKHGVNASKLLIKYLPLGGAPGFAAAKALETLQVTKWINILASLIDFVTGKGNIMNFFNALKELVGDIFKIIGDAIASLIQNPQQITNALNSAVGAVREVTDALGNEIVGVFDPAVAAQNAAARRDRSLQSEEISNVEQLKAAYMDNAKNLLEIDPPESFSDAVNKMEASPGRGTMEPVGSTTMLGGYRMSPEAEAEYNELEDARKGLAEILRTTPGRGGGSSQLSSIMRRLDLNPIYLVPYLLYLRENYANRPEWANDLPPLPDWGEQDFYDKAAVVNADKADGRESDFVRGLKPFFAALAKGTEKARKQAYDDQIETDRAKNEEYLAGEAQRAKEMDERNAARPEKYKAAVQDFARKTNQPVPQGDDPFAEEFQSTMPVMTAADDYYVALVTDGILSGDGSGPKPATAEKLKEQWKEATKTHTIQGYLERLKAYMANIYPGGQDPTGDYWIKYAEQQSFPAKKLIEFVKKMPKGVQKLKDFAETLEPGPQNDKKQKQWVLAMTDPEAFMKANPLPVMAPIPALPAPPPPPALPSAPAAAAEPEAPAATAEPKAAAAGAEPGDDEDNDMSVGDMYPEMFGEGMTGRGKHPFQHLQSRPGKRPRIGMLDPYFFEGTL